MIDRVTGSIDLPLEPKGEVESMQLGLDISHSGGVDMIVSSPMRRAQSTAAHVQQANPMAVTADLGAGLAPWSLGALEGQPEHYAKKIISAYMQNPDAVMLGRAKASTQDGESYVDHLERYIPTLQAMLNHAKDNPDTRLLGITHSRNVGIANQWLKAGKPSDLRKVGIANGNYKPARLYRVGDKGLSEAQGTQQPGVYLATHGSTSDNT